MAEGIPVKLVIRRIGIAVIGVGTLGVIVSNSAGAVGGSRYTDMAFPTPEAAIQHYTKGVSQGDAAAIFESFSIQSTQRNSILCRTRIACRRWSWTEHSSQLPRQCSSN